MKLTELTTAPPVQWKDTELAGVRVKVAGLKTIAFRRRLDVIMGMPSMAKKVRAGGEIEATARDQAFNRAMVDAVLFDWEGVEDDGPDGAVVPVAFAKDIALKLLSESVKFRDAVIAAAADVDADRQVAEEELTGN